MAVRIGISYVENEEEPTWKKYLQIVRAAGAEPVVLATARICPRSDDQEPVVIGPDHPAIRWMGEVDGLLLTGGTDIDPTLYHEESRGSQSPHRARDDLEMAQFRLARARRLPILGICRGAQFLNVAFGGSLVQDLPTAGSHRADGQRHESRAHRVLVAAHTCLARVLADHPTRDLVIEVNSRHHQGVPPPRLARDLVAAAYSCVSSDQGESSVIEGMETPDTRAGREFVLAVQWHPERVDDVVSTAPGQSADFRELSHRLLRAFVAAAQTRRQGGA
ncbi:MAG: gamma-glutamyl-gamma-aminobutyrate hydrolase family protein [Chloroflexi bacterium]|nr:gamma-glutamyl-gamma-aminobutyrate hydrolase family protein [Chloroflexota bacterium]